MMFVVIMMIMIDILLRTLLKQGPYGGRPVVKRVLVVTPGSLVKVSQTQFHCPLVQIGSRLPGEVPLSGTFPGNPIVWTLAVTSPGGPTREV